VILAQGDASRLHRRLVEERQLGVSIGTYWQEGIDPGLFWIIATLPEGGDPAVLENAIDEELAKIRSEGVTEAELSRARNLVFTAFWQQLATNSGKARLVGEYEVMYGSYQRLFDVPAAFARVTQADIKAVAQEILVPDGRTVGVLVPPPDEAAAEGEE
jgi:zinc protease